MFNKLVDIICEYVEVEPENVKPESRFIEDLGFTSFDFMSMLGELEDEFDVRLTSQRRWISVPCRKRQIIWKHWLRKSKR